MKLRLIKWGISMKIWDFDYESETIWTYSDDAKAIYKIDSKTSEVKLVKMFGRDCKESYRGICSYKGLIYLAPQNNTDKILIYDLDKDTKSTIGIDKDYLPKGGQHNLFIEIVRYGSRLYFIPGRYEAIIVLEQTTGEMLYIDGYISKIKDKILPTDNNLVTFNGVSKIDDTHILINGWKVNTSIILDLRTADYESIEFDNSERGVRGATLVSGRLFTSFKNSLGIYLKNTKYENFEKISNHHGRLYSYNNKIYIVDSSAKSIYKMDGSDLSRIENVYLCDAKIQSDNPFFLVKQYDNRLIILNLKDEYFIIFDMKLETALIADISKIISFSVGVQLYDKKVPVFEDEYLKLEKFISTIVDANI